MHRAGTGGGDADSHLTGELGVGGRHERRHLLVADLHELDAAGSVEVVDRLVEAGDAVTGVAEDALHAPGLEPLHDELAGVFCHVARA